MLGPSASIIMARDREPTTPGREVRLTDSVRPGTATPHPVYLDEFNLVGQYDVDQLLEPPMQRLLDHMAATPSAFRAVRFFHALDSGSPAKTIDDDPLDGGIVWPQVDAPTDFSRTFAGLTALTERGLQPFIGLNFFPRAVSPHAATPPTSLRPWQQLLRRFLDALAAHPRFGPEVIRTGVSKSGTNPTDGLFGAPAMIPITSSCTERRQTR